jgi:hypothetical protein
LRLLREKNISYAELTHCYAPGEHFSNLLDVIIAISSP